MVKKEVMVAERDPATKAAAELKRELKRILQVIIEEDKDDSGFDTIDRAKKVLYTLWDLKAKRTTSLGLDEVFFSCSEGFRCPLSKQLMRDPVTVATGKTYDMPFIQKWLK